MAVGEKQINNFNGLAGFAGRQREDVSPVTERTFLTLVSIWRRRVTIIGRSPGEGRSGLWLRAGDVSVVGDAETPRYFNRFGDPNPGGGDHQRAPEALW